MGFIKRIFNSNGRKQEMAQRERTHATHAQLARNIETSFMKMDRERKSLFESRAGIETNPNREERDVLRISRPLNGDETGEPCELLSHQGVWLRNKNGSGPAFSFLNSGRRKGQGLKMTIEYDAEPEKNSWRLKDAEFAGKTRASDADAYNSCRAWRKVAEPYDLSDSNCMHGVKGVTNDLTSGRSVLRPAPIERIPELVLENLNARGVVNTVKLLKSGSQISSYRSGPSGAPVPSNYQSPQSFRSTPSYQPEPHYRPEPSFQPTPSYQPTPSFQPTPTYERQYISQPVQQSYQPQQYYYYNDDD